MKAVIQRVREAAVSIGGEERARIGSGLLILLGVAVGDTEEEARWLAAKTASLRIFEDGEGKLNRSILDEGGQALVVSQFTLYGDCRKGNRPSFTGSASGSAAEALYAAYCESLRGNGVPVQTGVFGAMMDVHLINQGPVTLIVEREARS